MARKSKPLTCTFFIGDKQVDKLPPEYLDKMAERLSLVMSRYYTAHPDEFVRLVKADEEKKLTGKEIDKVIQNEKTEIEEMGSDVLSRDSRSGAHDAGDYIGHHERGCVVQLLHNID